MATFSAFHHRWRDMWSMDSRDVIRGTREATRNHKTRRQQLVVLRNRWVFFTYCLNMSEKTLWEGILATVEPHLPEYLHWNEICVSILYMMVSPLDRFVQVSHFLFDRTWWLPCLFTVDVCVIPGRSETLYSPLGARNGSLGGTQRPLQLLHKNWAWDL